MLKGKYERRFTERKCRKCGETFMGRGRAYICDKCKYTCPVCGGPKKWRSGTWCYPCSLKHRDMSKSKHSIKKAQKAALSTEAREKRKRSLLGHEVSEQTRRKISKATKGQKWRKEAGRRVGASWKGKRRSESWKRKARERVLGSKNPMWKDGSSAELYSEGWTEELKESIRIRDNRLCRACSKNKHKNGREMDVHHIDESKDNHNPENLISLCHSCHQLITAKSKTLKELLQ